MMKKKGQKIKIVHVDVVIREFQIHQSWRDKLVKKWRIFFARPGSTCPNCGEKKLVQQGFKGGIKCINCDWGS